MKYTFKQFENTLRYMRNKWIFPECEECKIGKLQLVNELKEAIWPFIGVECTNCSNAEFFISDFSSEEPKKILDIKCKKEDLVTEKIKEIKITLKKGVKNAM